MLLKKSFCCLRTSLLMDSSAWHTQQGFHPILLTKIFGFLSAVRSHFHQRAGAQDTWYNVEAAFSNNHPNVKGHAVQKKQSKMIQQGEKRAGDAIWCDAHTPDQRLWRKRNLSLGNQVNCYKVERRSTVEITGLAFSHHIWGLCPEELCKCSFRTHCLEA